MVTYRRQPILCEEPLRKALRNALHTVRRKWPFTIDAWVLLPDHLHCIWTLPPGDTNFSTRWSLIKRQVSLACSSFARAEWMTASKHKHRESTLWQRRFWEHQIRNELDFQRHLDYIHLNPVKHGLCNRVVEWPYFSTFHRYVGQGIYPPEWAGNGDEIITAGE